MPRLREDCERSRALASRAIERARRITAEALTTRRLLEARMQQPRDAASLDAQIWNAAARELVRLTRERDRELGTLAHELRQPLAAALAAERLLAVGGPNTAERARGVLTRQLTHLAQLVDNLLDYSRLAMPAAGGAHARVDLREIVGSAVETVEPTAVERSQLLSFAPGEPVSVLGDATRLRQAIVNLVQNAARYTGPHGRIDVVVERRGADAIVKVRDTGEGIPPDRLEHIFEPFVRLSGTGPGLGIGLPLVRRVAELHGGGISASSDGEGHGSVFTFRLPALAE